jgi:hypothetical protein
LVEAQLAQAVRGGGTGVGPGVVAGQVDVLPAERPDMSEEAVVGDVAVLAEPLRGELEIAAVPQHNGGDQQIQAAGPVVLVLVRPITDLA